VGRAKKLNGDLRLDLTQFEKHNQKLQRALDLEFAEARQVEQSFL